MRHAALVEPFKKPAGVSNKAQLKRAEAAYNERLVHVVCSPLEDAAGGREMPDLANTMHMVSPQVECHNLDHPEASLLAGTKQDRCEDCVAKRSHFAAFDQPAPLRDIETSRAMVEAAQQARASAVCPLAAEPAGRLAHD